MVEKIDGVRRVAAGFDPLLVAEMKSPSIRHIIIGDRTTPRVWIEGGQCDKCGSHPVRGTSYGVENPIELCRECLLVLAKLME
jgi:hypothetical protein